jgi:hypothetical protein
MMLEQLWVLIGVAGAGWVYYSGIRVRETALRAGRLHCREMGLQMLDQTVSRQRISLSRGSGGRWRIWRSFGFEFTSDGERRYRGEIIMLGHEVKQVRTEAHRILH